MDVESKDLRGFDEEDLKVLSSFASQVSTSLRMLGFSPSSDRPSGN